MLRKGFNCFVFTKGRPVIPDKVINYFSVFFESRVVAGDITFPDGMLAREYSANERLNSFSPKVGKDRKSGRKK